MLIAQPAQLVRLRQLELIQIAFRLLLLTYLPAPATLVNLRPYLVFNLCQIADSVTILLALLHIAYVVVIG